MNADGKSDDFVVPSTRVNKAATAVAESVEERKSPKGSIAELPSMFQTLCWIQHPLEWHGTHDGYQRRVLRSFDLTEEPYFEVALSGGLVQLQKVDLTAEVCSRPSMDLQIAVDQMLEHLLATALIGRGFAFLQHVGF